MRFIEINFVLYLIFYFYFVNRNYADPLLSFSSSVGEKDYSDRLLYKVGKHVCIFDPETGKQQFFDGSRQPIVGRLIFSSNIFDQI